jgi:hypothetical protein
MASNNFSVQHAIAHAEALATIPGVLNQLHLRVGATVLANDFRSVIARTVVYDQDLDIPIVIVDVTKNVVEGGAQAIAFVIGRNDDAVSQRTVLGSQFPVLSNDSQNLRQNPARPLLLRTENRELRTSSELYYATWLR